MSNLESRSLIHCSKLVGSCLKPRLGNSTGEQEHAAWPVVTVSILNKHFTLLHHCVAAESVWQMNVPSPAAGTRGSAPRKAVEPQLSFGRSAAFCRTIPTSCRARTVESHPVGFALRKAVFQLGKCKSVPARTRLCTRQLESESPYLLQHGYV